MTPSNISFDWNTKTYAIILPYFSAAFKKKFGRYKYFIFRF